MYEKTLGLDIGTDVIRAVQVAGRGKGLHVSAFAAIRFKENGGLESSLKELFAEYKKGTFVKSAIPEILAAMARGKNAKDAVKEKNLHRITGKELEKIVEENKGDIKKIMAKYRLRIDPKDIAKVKK